MEVSESNFGVLLLELALESNDICGDEPEVNFNWDVRQDKVQALNYLESYPTFCACCCHGQFQLRAERLI